MTPIWICFQLKEEREKKEEEEKRQVMYQISSKVILVSWRPINVSGVHYFCGCPHSNARQGLALYLRIFVPVISLKRTLFNESYIKQRQEFPVLLIESKSNRDHEHLECCYVIMAPTGRAILPSRNTAGSGYSSPDMLFSLCACTCVGRSRQEKESRCYTSRSTEGLSLRSWKIHSTETSLQVS